MLDVRRLQVLRSVVATGSVGGAAQALGYTPSSISQQLSVLQRETGVQLFEPAGRGIRPTSAARLLDEHAAAVFEQLAQAERALTDYSTGRQTRLRFEYFATAGRALVAPAIAAFKHHHPEVQIELHLQPQGDPAQRISRDESDVALTVAKAPLRTDGVTWTHLFDDPFEVVLPAGHPLGEQTQIHLAELAALPWVTHEWPLDTCSAQVIQACTALGFTPDYQVECNDIDTAQGLVAAGAGIAVMPRLGLAHPLPGVTIRPLQAPAPDRRIYALHRPGPHSEELINTLRGLHPVPSHP